VSGAIDLAAGDGDAAAVSDADTGALVAGFGSLDSAAVDIDIAAVVDASDVGVGDGGADAAAAFAVADIQRCAVSTVMTVPVVFFVMLCPFKQRLSSPVMFAVAVRTTSVFR